MPRIVFYREFYSDKDMVKPNLLEALEFIRQYLRHISEAELYDLRLAYSELLYNAVAHGNGFSIEKKVRFTVEIIDYTIYTQIEDEGSGYDYVRHLALEVDENSLLSENGRGIRLVQSLMDSMSFNETGNIVYLMKSV